MRKPSERDRVTYLVKANVMFTDLGGVPAINFEFRHVNAGNPNGKGTELHVFCELTVSELLELKNQITNAIDSRIRALDMFANDNSAESTSFVQAHREWRRKKLSSSGPKAD